MDEWMVGRLEGGMDRQTDGEIIGLGAFCFSEEGFIMSPIGHGIYILLPQHPEY